MFILFYPTWFIGRYPTFITAWYGLDIFGCKITGLQVCPGFLPIMASTTGGSDIPAGHAGDAHQQLHGAPDGSI